jgi:transposase
VGGRIDWKYLLGLDLSDPGFDLSVLTEFRARLRAHEAGQRLFERLIQRLSEGGWIKKRGVQGTDSTHVLAAVRRLNRLELVGETLPAALNAIAEVEPEWLQQWLPVAWFERYRRRIEEWRLPAGQQSQEQLAEQIGRDGSRLLDEVCAEPAPASLRLLPEVEGLRQSWVHQFLWQEGHIQLRTKDDLPPAHLRQRSASDPEAHYGHKRDLSWFGYKVHLSESCDSDLPHLIPHAATTDASKTDVEETEAIHQALAQRDVLPSQPIVDAGYVDAALILQRRASLRH